MATTTTSSSTTTLPVSVQGNNKINNDSDSGSENDGISKVLTSPRCNSSGQRTIGYAILPGGGGVVASNSNDDDNAATNSNSSNNNKNTTAICYFYPLSGCSAGSKAYLKSSLTRFNCRFLVVDRPGVGATSDLQLPLPPPPTSSSPSSTRHSEHFALDRIHGHVQDVLDVLQAEGIEHVYVYGVCIGHPYAVELCRQLLHQQQSQQQASSSSPADADPAAQNESKSLLIIKLHGLTLVAPFVSTACPVSWKIARLGAAVPNCVMTSAVRGAMAIGNTLMPHFIKPSMLKKLITPAEQQDFEWTDADFERFFQITMNVKNESSNHAKSVEAQLGVASIWQFEICDKFATESGCGLVLDDNDNANTDTTNSSTEQGTSTRTIMKPPALVVLPIRIHASPHDKLATLASVQWIARRCYGGGRVQQQEIITLHENIHSHESMTFFGGPPHNPSLLLQAAHEWGLLAAAN